ncbi:sulfatase-like hydrolase/transferase [Tsuneonella sp. HG222]
MTNRVVWPKSWPRALAGVAVFALAYAIANRFQLTQYVLYRWAAHDEARALANFGWLAAQAVCWLGAVWLLPRRWFILALSLAAVSIMVNLGYGETIGDTLDAGRISWLLAESRQAGHAAGEFTGLLAFAAIQMIVAKVLFGAVRFPLRRAVPPPRDAVALPAGLTLALAPSLLAVLGGWPLATGAERNTWHLAAQVLTAPPPPPRAPVGFSPDTAGSPDHIVWLVDESVAHGPFAQLILPSTAPFAPVDFGEAVSLGNCSAPANLALRSGVDVRRAGPGLDLRRPPSVWAYARKAGYRTMLIDGQTTGAPQNLLLPPERALIDDLRSMAQGIDTDRRIAALLNRQMKAPGRSFTYAVLRGVHFQYRDHVPPGTLPAHAPAAEQYRAALRYSKRDFFRTLLGGVDRSRVAVIYTSDHGQNLAPGVLPHCSPEQVPAEYMVPLLAFVPPELAARYPNPSPRRHSLSQVLPTTLAWMGYDQAAVQQRYDNDLTQGPLGYVRFGRGVVPLREGDPVEIEVSSTFP